DVGMLAHTSELVHGTHCADNSKVLHRDMPGQRGGVGEDDVIAYLGVVPNMHIGHQQAVGPELRYAATPRGPTRDGDVLADVVVVPNLNAGGFIPALQVLRCD